MKNIKKIIKWLAGSADNDPGGASSKKLTGFFCFLLIGMVTVGWGVWAYLRNDWAMLPFVLTALIGAGLGALGINSNEKIKMNDAQLKSNDTGLGDKTE